MGPIILLALIPTWQKLCIPLLRNRGYEPSALCSVAIGGICAGLAFICAGLLEQTIEHQINSKMVAKASTPSSTTSSPIELNITAITAVLSFGQPISYENKTNIPILWQLPQFFLLMMGEILLSIPGLQFSFTEAPTSMKSVLTASWFINNAIGNLIVVVITELQPVCRQSSEFFLYAALMFLGIFTFIWIASGYNKNRDMDVVLEEQHRKTLKIDKLEQQSEKLSNDNNVI